MRKTIYAMLLIGIFCTSAFAAKLGVNSSLLSGAPDYRNGNEYDSTTIYQMHFTGGERIENQKEFNKDVSAATRELQKQVDEDAKRFADAVAQGRLLEVEKILSEYASATGAQFSVTKNKSEWTGEYKTVTDYGIRTDTVTVYHDYAKVRIVTKVQPFGVMVFSVAQIKK